MQIANRIANTKFHCGMATSGMPVFIAFFLPSPRPIFLQSGLIVRLNDLRNSIKKERRGLLSLGFMYLHLFLSPL
jgi:hypothetical protein